MTEFTKEYIRSVRMCSYLIEPPASEVIEHLCDEIERLQQRIAELEIQLKSKDIIINNQQGRLNYHATKDLLGGKNEHG
jgi:hypothetical protein